MEHSRYLSLHTATVAFLWAKITSCPGGEGFRFYLMRNPGGTPRYKVKLVLSNITKLCSQ